jgi:ParB family chromosome partitioning protein
MVLDLSALDVDVNASLASSGKPLEIELGLIDEDSEQPRKEFSAEAMQEMEASIRLRGVKSPVSVRPNPDSPGRWILNFGARRYRGSKLAGKTTIPAFVDETHDNYDQVIENLQREDLKPMELALFIQKRLKAGDKKGEIAKKLGKDASIVTQHLALIDTPPCIEEVYMTGKCTTAKTLYELRGLYEKFPKEVDAWCLSTEVIDRHTVMALGDELKNRRGPQSGSAPAKIIGIAGESPQEIPVKEVPVPGNEVKSSPSERSDGLMKKPMLIIEYDDRTAVILLNRRPTKAGLIHIRYEDDGSEQEVDAGQCKINLLTEA